jgi:glutamate dehydrogenase/leucine dehydrogenase
MAVQGCGHVGTALVLQLHALGARPIVSRTCRISSRTRGGAIYLCRALAGWTDAQTYAAVESIFDSSLEVIRRAEQ